MSVKESKLSAFRAFDFEHDARWQAYLKTIELPAVDAQAALSRVKAKWYKREVDAEFEIEWVQAAVKPQQFMSRSPPQSTPPRPQQPASSAPRPPPSTSWQGSPAATAGLWDEGTQLRLFAMHALLILCALFHLVPILPIPLCSLRCYWWFMRIAVFAQMYKVVKKFGWPRGLWPFSWPTLQVWLSQAMGSSDFFFGMTAFAFNGTRSSISLAMVPQLIVAGRHVLLYGSRHFAGSTAWSMTGGKVHAWVSAREALVNQAATWSEIALGFLLVLLLLTPSRNFIIIFFYWNMLKMRYVAPESAASHRMAWAHLGRISMPYRLKFPLLEKGVQLIQGWFRSGTA